MPRADRLWNGDEWQQYIQLLLKQHYGPSTYVEVPDQHLGDLGLEGFATDGCAYQCYAAEGLVDAAEMLKRQRRKMNADIRKFIQNRLQLIELFGQVKISRWLLVVPSHVSRLLVSYGETKAAEVRAANLPYVDDGFRVHVITDDHFPVARQQLVGAGIESIRVTVDTSTMQSPEEWVANSGNASALATLDGKLSRVESLRNVTKREDYRTELLRQYLLGRALMQRLRDDYPATHRSIGSVKTGQEARLSLTSALSLQAPHETLAAELARYDAQLEDAVVSLAAGDRQLLVAEGVTDWLIRCPLDFPEPTT